MTATTQYSAFWFYAAQPSWFALTDEARDSARADFGNALENAGQVTLRGAYSLIGLRHDADFALWVHSDDVQALQALARSLRRTRLAPHVAQPHVLLGLVLPSQYVADHVPAFARGVPPRRFLSVYPFVKTHEWYLLPFEERRAMMATHGRMGQPWVETVLTNTVYSFGIADHEFVVAFESDDPVELVRMVEALRAAEARTYTDRDTPIFLGQRKPLAEVLADLG
ncbi:MAG: chlorite dismutase family protein [Chloroflexi bacterium]|nr:chlorite dismutase family protein [Chloroflexota bacterium]MBI4506593.1 chlorite dismutase family protein [Chloroflexota bacterium]